MLICKPMKECASPEAIAARLGARWMGKRAEETVQDGSGQTRRSSGQRGREVPGER